MRVLKAQVALRGWLFVFAFFCTAANVAKADSYTFRIVENANHGTFVAGDDYGDFVISLIGPSADVACGNVFPCYRLFDAVNNVNLYSGTLPALRSDPNPVAGAGCNLNLALLEPGYTSRCVNGHQVAYGFYNGSRGFWTGTGSALEFLIGAALTSPNQFLMSTNGNIFFGDGFGENLYVGLDVSAAIAPTPEPSTLALLATGGLGLVFAGWRRRMSPA